MPRRKIEKTRADELLDELLEDYQGPEAILGKDGLLKQLSKRLVERALQAELSHHLEQEHQEIEDGPPAQAEEAIRNSRNGNERQNCPRRPRPTSNSSSSGPPEYF